MEAVSWQLLRRQLGNCETKAICAVVDDVRLLRALGDGKGQTSGVEEKGRPQERGKEADGRGGK